MTSPSSSDQSSTSCVIMNHNANHFNTTTARSHPSPSSVHSAPTILHAPRIPPAPSIPSVPVPCIPTLPLQPPPVTQLNGVDPYTNHAVPVIVVPTINLMNHNNTKRTTASTTTTTGTIAPPNDQIKRILEKKRKGKEPLNPQEMKILATAVQSARQQFLGWYQQQALRQQALLLNHHTNLMRNGNVIHNTLQSPMAQPLNPKQIALLQQRQLLQQQQQIIQTQLALQMATNQWNANGTPRNNGTISFNNNNPYTLPRNSNTYHNNNNNNIDDNCDLTTYFALPRPEEFDTIFYNESKQDDDDEDVMSILGVHVDAGANNEDLCFDIELEGLGTFQFGNERTIPKPPQVNATPKNIKKKQARLYELLGVRDITNESCQWLIRDLMRSQSELKSDATSYQQERNVVMTQLKHVTTDVIPKPQMDQIIAQMTRNPSIPHSVLYSKICDVYCRNNSFIEISHVDISRAHIEVIVKKPKAINITHDLTYDKKKLLNELQITTLEFFTLCNFMLQHFDPSKDAETLPIEHLSRDDILYKTAQKLRENPNYFKIPTLHTAACTPPPPPPPPRDPSSFATQINNTNTNVNQRYPWPPLSYTNHNISSIPSYHPLPIVNPLNLNQSRMMNYNVSNPYATPQVNLNLTNTRLIAMPATAYSPHAHHTPLLPSQPKKPHIKSTANPTKWNVSGLK